MNNYIEASKILSSLLEKNGPGLKSLIYKKSKGGKGKGKKGEVSSALFAMVSRTLKCRKAIDEVILEVNKELGGGRCARLREEPPMPSEA